MTAAARSVASPFASSPELHSYVSAFAGLALTNIIREYPNKLDHVLNDAGELRSPRDLHPVFYGSFDWHSCVHMHWLLARLLHRDPVSPESALISAVFDAQFTKANVAGEIAYLQQPSRASFERMYGLIDLQNGAEATEYWLATNNFYAITQYNRSYFYAMSVVDLGRAVRVARAGK